MPERGESPVSLGYEFAREEEARAAAAPRAPPGAPPGRRGRGG